MASKGLAALPRIKRGALGRGCGRKGSGALPLPRAAVISTRLRVLLQLAGRIAAGVVDRLVAPEPRHQVEVSPAAHPRHGRARLSG